MKLLIILLALVAASCALPRLSVQPDPDIINDLQQFIKCIDQAQVQRDVNDAINNDPEVLKVAVYLTTDKFRDQVKIFDKDPTYLAILKDYEEHGVPAYEFVNEILKSFKIDPIDQLTKKQEESHTVGSFDSLFDKLMTDVDGKCSKEVFDDRVNADPKFKALVEHLKSDEYKQLVEAFKASETVKNTLEEFNKVGLNVAKYVEYLKTVYHYDW